MATVIIRSITEESTRSWFPDREAVAVEIDGVLHGPFYYGGEPEDNCRSRQYSWVEDLLHKMATALGAEVKLENTP